MDKPDDSNFELDLDLDRVFTDKAPEENVVPTVVEPKPTVAAPTDDPRDDLQIEEISLDEAPRQASLLSSRLPKQKKAPKTDVEEVAEPDVPSKQAWMTPQIPTTPTESMEGEAKYAERGNKAKVEGFRRKFHQPATVLASAAITREAELFQVSGDRSANHGIRKMDQTPEYSANKAHAVLADLMDEETLNGGMEPTMWIRNVVLLLFGIGICYVGWIYVSSFSAQMKEPSGPEQPRVAMSERGGKAQQALISYLKAISTADKGAWVIDGEKMLPSMDTYYSKGGSDPDVDVASIKPVMAKQIGREMWFIYELDLRNTSRSVSAQVREGADGKYLVDWEDFVSPGSAIWAEFLRTQPAEPAALRVNLKPAQVFNPPYEEKDYVCFELASNARPDNAAGTKYYGYAKKSERVTQNIQSQLKENPAGVTLKLYLKFEPNAGKEQILISEIVPTWDPLNH